MNHQGPTIEELTEWVTEFKSEGTTFWRNRFKEDSRPGGWNEGMYSKGDEFTPFFSEKFLYNLLGKQDARSVLYYMREALKLAGAKEEELGNI